MRKMNPEMLQLRSLLRSTVALLALPLTILPSVGTAQEVSPSDDGARIEAQGDATANDGIPDDTIVVTANRVEQDLQDVSGVVQAFSADRLRQDGVSDFRNLQAVVPGLSISNAEGNVDIFIRGVGSANNTELGDPAAAPHVNGSYIPRPRGLGVMFYDLERVEVNKGPQGTLYGRNALAGTLNIITAKPKLGEFGGYAQAEVSNRSSYGVEGAVNLPLGPTLAARVAGVYVNKDFGYRNVSTDAQASRLRPGGLEENYAGRASLLWAPTSSLSVSLIGDYGKETGTGYPGSSIWEAVIETGLRAEDLNLKDVVYRGLQGEMTNELWGVQGQVRYDFANFSVEGTGSFRSVDFRQRNASASGIDYPGRDLGAVQYDNYSNTFWHTKSESQIFEVRIFANEDQELRWNTGAFYFNEDQQVYFFSLADRGYCCYSGTEYTMPTVEGKSFAAYLDATYPVNDVIRAFGGVRYTRERKFRYGIGGNWALVLGGADFACCMGTRLGTEGFVPTGLSRPSFDRTEADALQQRVDAGIATGSEVTRLNQLNATFLIQGIQSPGLRDTLIQQIQAIANGSNPLGTCIDRPDIDNGFVNCPASGTHTYATVTAPRQQIGRSKFDYFDWRVGGEIDLTPTNMLYAKVSTGHKAGGFNDSFDPNLIPETFAPEKLLVYEVGSRNSFDAFGRRAVFNVTGFYYDYDDQVFQDLTCINQDTTQTPPECNGFALVNRNVGASRLYGLEAETRFKLPAGFGLDLNAVWLNTKVTQGVIADSRATDYSVGGNTPLIDLSGNRLPLASKFSATARLSQVISLGSGRFDWQALASYRSSFYLSQFNEDDVVFLDGSKQTALEAGFPDKQEGFVTVNLGAGYTIGRIRLEGWVTNLFDKEASLKALVGTSLNLRYLNDARSYGLRARINF